MATIYEIPKNQEELTTAEKERMAVYNELLESKNKQKPLLGRVILCKPNEKASDSKMRVMAVVDYKGWKILIPIGLMGLDLSACEDYGREKKESLYKRYIISMIGLSPSMDAPTAIPENPSSDTGVSSILSGNFLYKSPVTPKQPP